ncbi:MAG: hypothetical protein EZS28_052744, partial [Streblomastix strix]
YEGHAIGLISLTSNADVQSLQSYFQIGEYDNFVDETGSPNAVCITMFCLKAEFEHRSIDFIKAVFDNYPDCLFLFLTVSHSLPEFPLLVHFNKVFVYMYNYYYIIMLLY